MATSPERERFVSRATSATYWRRSLGDPDHEGPGVDLTAERKRQPVASGGVSP